MTYLVLGILNLVMAGGNLALFFALGAWYSLACAILSTAVGLWMFYLWREA